MSYQSSINESPLKNEKTSTASSEIEVFDGDLAKSDVVDTTLDRGCTPLLRDLHPLGAFLHTPLLQICTPIAKRADVVPMVY
jgi:hypothetical protein